MEIILVVLILVPLAPICTEAGLGAAQFSAQRYIPIYFNIFALEVQFLISHSQNNLTPNCIPRELPYDPR